MEITSVLLILRILACLGGGFWLARQLRGIIPGIILRLMPSKHRFSENAFRIQARFGAIVAIVITLGGAALLNEGINWVIAQARTQTRMSIRPELRPPAPLSLAPSWTEQEHLRSQQPEYPAETEKTEPAYYPEQMEYTDPIRRARPAPQSGDWCFQLHAFDDENNAREQQTRLSRKLPLPVHLAYLPGDTGPYKLYIAGFSTREEAVRFAKKHGLTGFPRPAHQLRSYSD